MLAGIVTRGGVAARKPPDARNDSKESLCAGGVQRRATATDRQYPPNGIMQLKDAAVTTHGVRHVSLFNAE